MFWNGYTGPKLVLSDAQRNGEDFVGFLVKPPMSQGESELVAWEIFAREIKSLYPMVPFLFVGTRFNSREDKLLVEKCQHNYGLYKQRR